MVNFLIDCLEIHQFEDKDSFMGSQDETALSDGIDSDNVKYTNNLLTMCRFCILVVFDVLRNEALAINANNNCKVK
jgi:hypothetical protein